MKPICIIPARGNSKGVPKKNIRKIMGKPLIAYTIEKSIKSNIFSHVIVSTEDKVIAAISRKFGAKVPFMRPKYLATDNATTDDVLVHAVKKLFDLGFEFDVMVCRDCTVPFIRNKDIRNSIKLLKEKKANLVIGVYNQHLNPYYNIVEYTKTKNLKLCKKLGERPTSRQNAPKVFQMNGLHTFDVKKFLFPDRKVRTEISKAIPLEIPIESGIMIDTEFEFQLTKLIIENQHEYFTGENYTKIRRRWWMELT
tara:strand:+ start:1277 stop:2035 length:759 start_codon:yes stop_codon:yes gene_type:complete